MKNKFWKFIHGIIYICGVIFIIKITILTIIIDSFVYSTSSEDKIEDKLNKSPWFYNNSIISGEIIDSLKNISNKMINMMGYTTQDFKIGFPKTIIVFYLIPETDSIAIAISHNLDCGCQLRNSKLDIEQYYIKIEPNNKPQIIFSSYREGVSINEYLYIPLNL